MKQRPKKHLTSYALKKALERPHELVEGMSSRLLRMQYELVMPALVFRRENIHNTIVFFGSARILSKKEARKELKEARARIAGAKRKSQKMQERLEAAEQAFFMSHYYTAAEELAYRLTLWSKKWENTLQQFPICSGGGPGIMEAANKGASRASGRSIGLNISIPKEQTINAYVSPELAFKFNYFLIRKFWLFYFAKALVVFPGGMGTMDEIFEVFTLMQTNKAGKYVPTVLFGSEYWKELVNFDTMIRHGMIGREDLGFFRYFDEVESAFQWITGELEKYYVGGKYKGKDWSVRVR